MMLLHLLRWLRGNTKHQCDVLLLRGGPLRPEFATAATLVAPKTFALVQDLAALRARLDRLPPRLGFVRRASPPLRLAERLAGRLARSTFRNHAEYDLVYCNTASCGAALQALAPRCPVVTHIHELEYALRLLSTSFAATQDWTARFIAASHAVARNLTENHGIDTEKIHVVHEFVDTRRPVDSEQAHARIRATLGVPEDAFLVGGCGPLEWRKGTDLWVQMAHSALAKGGASEPARPLHFVWIGGAQSGLYRDELLYDVEKLGLTGHVHFVPEVEDAAPWLAALDVFALASREDPFPLVCLEAASHGVPIVCFAGAGGMPEFVETDCGLAVPYADSGAMAAAIIELVQDEDGRAILGANARQKVRERHDITIGAPQILAVLEGAGQSRAAPAPIAVSSAAREVAGTEKPSGPQ